MKLSGDKLREIRLKQGFSQEALAHRAGFAVRTLRRLEQGKSQPQPATLKALADSLGVHVEELWTPSTERTSISSAFVGRDALLDALGEDVEAVLSGTPRTILLGGEPGIGKTRTAEFLCASDRLAGAEVVWGRCLEGSGTLPLRPWLQVIEKLVRTRSVDSLRELLGRDASALAAACSEVRDLPIDFAPQPQLAPEQERLRFLDACVQFVSTIAREGVLVIVLDDLHYADTLSLALWEHTAREVSGCKLLLVGTYRNVGAPPNPSLERIVAETALLPSAGSTVTLGGLNVDEVGDLLESLTASRAPDHFVSHVHERTAGNPLFIRGLARNVNPERYEERLPDSILSVVRARVGQLDTTCRSLLDAASVIGREFDARVVAAAAGIRGTDCLAAMDDAFEAGLVTSGVDGVGWRFIHMVVVEGIYASLPPGRRAQLHLAVAHALEERWQNDPDRVIGLVAKHYQSGLSAADPGQVFAASIKAADQAERAYSFEEAGDHFEAALTALEHVTKVNYHQRFETLLRLVEQRRLVGSRERWLDAGSRALTAARKVGPEAIARAAISMHDIKEWAMVNEPEVIAGVEEGLGAIGDAQSADRVHLIAIKAHVQAYSHPELARALSKDAAEMAREFGGQVLREALYIRHYIAAGPDSLNERDEIVRELASEVAGRPGSESIVIAFVDAACDQLARGDARRAASWRELAETSGGSNPTLGMTWYLGMYDAGLALLRGDPDEAEHISLATFEVGRRIDQSKALISRAAHMMVIAGQRGDPEQAADTVEMALASQGLAPPAGSEGALLRSLGARYSVDCGRMARTSALIDACAADGFRAINRDLRWLGTVANLAHACAGLGDEDHACALYALLAPVERLHSVVPGPILYAGSLVGACAQLLEIMGRGEEAAEAYERAIEAEQTIGALQIVASSRRRLNRLRRSAPSAGD